LVLGNRELGIRNWGFELVPRLCLGTDIERLCLAWRSSEAEPLNGHSQAEPGNE